MELANGWCMETPKLTKIRITPASSRYSYLNNKFLLAKSSPESDSYDVLLFARRDVSEVVIPSFIRKIGSFAFNNCEFIKSIVVPEDSKLEIIEKYAFYNSSIEAITISANVSHLREKWCSGTSKLTSITISPSNKFYKYLNDAYIMSEMSPESGTFDVLHFARRDIKEAIIPKDVKMIDANAFDCCKQLNHVEIPVDSVLQEIGKFAFFCSSIETFFISPHITKICKGAFSDCNSLSRFEIPKNSQLDTIGGHAFSQSSIKSIFIPKGITHLGKWRFSGCRSLKDVEIEENSNLSIFESHLFSTTGIESFYVPPQITQISDNCFSFCQKLKRIEIPDNSELQIIGDYAFSFSSITSLFIPSNVETIGEYAFLSCDELKLIEFAEESKINIRKENPFETFYDSILLAPAGLIKKM